MIYSLTSLLKDDDEPEWMIEHELQEKRKAALHHRNEFESRLARIRAHEKKTKERYARGEPLHKRQVYLSRVNQVNFADMRLKRK